jgi:hypothetical protein
MHGARAALAALSGLAMVGAVAGCSAVSLTTASREHHSHTHHAITTAPPESTATATATPSDTPTPSPSTKHIVTVIKPPVHHAPPPKPPKPTKPSPKPTATSTPPPSPPPPPSTVYKDGTYGADGSYTSPGGTETLHVSLTISNDIIKSLSVTPVHVDPTAAEYEAKFDAAIGGIVIGRDLANANVGAVAGSSLTSIGYNSALATIRAAAKN